MKKKVLIVDDSQLTRSYHSFIVESAGFECTSAVDGLDGLEKTLLEHFDIIVTDINMQGMDGYEFIRRVRTNAEYDAVPIIIISTESRENDRQIGFTAGANLYVVKPADASRLVASINLIVGGE